MRRDKLSCNSIYVRDSSYALTRPYPHRIIMKSSTTRWGRLIRARKRVDPAPAFIQMIGPQTFSIRFYGVEKTNVEEYCVSEGCVRLPTGGKSKGRFGNPMTVRVSGKVEVFYTEG